MECVYPVCPRQVCRSHLSQDRAASVFNPIPKAVVWEAEQPSPNTWDRRAGGTRCRTRCSLCLHTPHLFPCLLQGLHRELLVGSDSQLSCSPGSSPGAGEKRARGEGQTQGPHGGACSSFPQRNPVDVSRTQTCGGSAWNEPWECPKMLSLLHHNITMLNKHHLCLCLAPQ